MHMVTLPAWRSEASAAQRAYLAQSAALYQLLDTGGVPGWDTLDECRITHSELAPYWQTVKWPALCGPRGGEVSRFVPSLNELRMAPQDLNVLAYSHELAHSIAPQAGHRMVWAATQIKVLDVMSDSARHDDAGPIANALIALERAYLNMGVIQ